MLLSGLFCQGPFHQPKLYLFPGTMKIATNSDLPFDTDAIDLHLLPDILAAFHTYPHTTKAIDIKTILNTDCTKSDFAKSTMTNPIVLLDFEVPLSPW